MFVVTESVVVNVALPVKPLGNPAGAALHEGFAVQRERSFCHWSTARWYHQAHR